MSEQVEVSGRKQRKLFTGKELFKEKGRSGGFNKKRISFFIVVIFLLKVFTPMLADRFSLEFEWQQVSSSRQDFSQYSG